MLDNACKAAAHKVRVDVVAHDKFVQIDVEDDGPGIPKEKRQLLLTRGTRLDSYKEGQGIGMAVLVAVVIIGGIKRIASVTEKIVPFMAGIYVLAALIILGANFTLIDDAFGLIFEGAFSGLGIAGGLIGVMIQGIRRGAFSNEAGVGSAAIAHSAVRTKYPASEGIVALLEPFVDTVVICTMTAFCLLYTSPSPRDRG